MVYVVKAKANTASGIQEGTIYSRSARELRRQIAADRVLPYSSWFASVTELMNVTGRPGFRDTSAVEIRVTILEYFAERGWEELSPEDTTALWECYNSLCNIATVPIQDATRYFLRSVIRSVIHPSDFLDTLVIPRRMYHEICEEWVDLKFRRNFKKGYLDFPLLLKTLRYEWLEARAKAAEHCAPAASSPTPDTAEFSQLTREWCEKHPTES